MAAARANSEPPRRGGADPRARRASSAGPAATVATIDNDADADTNTNTNTRLRPLFLWARLAAGRVLAVRVEDYDDRNRLRLARTPSGWRALPRTATYDAVRLPRRRRRGRPRRQKRGAPAPAPAPDVEASIPSHTIRIPSPPPPPEPDFDPTPLDNLLAAAELEFRRRRDETEDLDKFPFLADVDGVDPADAVAAEDLFFAPPGPRGERVAVDAYDGGVVATEDLFETISASHYGPDLVDRDRGEEAIDANELLDSLVEKGCEDHDVTAFDKDDGDYDDEDDDMLMAGAPVSDIIDRLERSLESPGRGEVASPPSVGETAAPFSPEIFEKPSTPSALSIADDEREAAPFEDEAVGATNDGSPPRDDREEDEEDDATATTESPVGTIETIEALAAAPPLDDDASDESDATPTDLSARAPATATTALADDLPRDLSCRRRPPSPSPSPRRPETPRPASRGSDAIQSPQPSGIPAVPSSPELFATPPCKTGSKSLFLETLLASPSPKMCFSSEPTVSKHQSEPLDLGKCRKSASPTVSSCSDEIRRPPRECGEPEAKRPRESAPDEPAPKPSEAFCDAASRPTRAPSRPVEAPSPLRQLRLLRTSADFDVPDPLLVPKERFGAILLSPAKEIPALLLQRPELRLPEAFAFPAVLQDPDILVVSLSQLEAILSKHCRNGEREGAKPPREPRPKPPTPSSERYCGASPSDGAARAAAGAEALAGEIDAATSAAIGQMLWLPYLGQFEAAMACSQSADFLKALTATTPPGYPAAPQYSDLSPIFSPQSRFAGSAGFPAMQALEYNNQLEFAMWQEAMAQANGATFQRALKTTRPPEGRKAAADAPAGPGKPQQPRGPSAARTSPIARGYPHGCGRSGPGGPYHPGTWPGYPGGRSQPRPSQYSPSGPRSSRPMRTPPTPSSSTFPAAFFPNGVNNNNNNNNDYLGASKPSSGPRGPGAPPAAPSAAPEPRPRISVKSLQNLLEPGPGLGPAASGLPPMRPPEPEVGSSTHLDETGQDAQAPLWHPLFGNQKAYNSAWNWTTVTVNGD